MRSTVSSKSWHILRKKKDSEDVGDGNGASGLLSAVHVGPAGGVRVEVVLAQAWRVVGGGEHVAGGQR